MNLGALDEIGRLVPSYELWTIRREGWLPVFAGVKAYERDRLGEGREELGFGRPRRMGWGA